MAATQLMGSSAKVTFTANIGLGAVGVADELALLANHWECTLGELEMHDVTAWGPLQTANNNSRQKLAGLLDTPKGRLSGMADAAVMFLFTAWNASPSTSTTIRLYINSTKYYTFTGVLKNFAVQATLGQPVTWSADFEGYGAATAV